MSQVEDAVSVEQDTYHALKKVFFLLDDCDRHFFTEYGLNSRQFWALQALDEQQGRPMVDLSHLLLTDKSNITGIVDRLESDGLAIRTPAAYDRRVILVRLTSEGRRIRDHIKAQHDARVCELVSSVEPDRLRILLNLLSDVGRNLEAYLGRAGDSAFADPADNIPGE